MQFLIFSWDNFKNNILYSWCKTCVRFAALFWGGPTKAIFPFLDIIIAHRSGGEIYVYS